MLSEGFIIDGRYEIVGKIGAGGMSDVYKAKDHTLERYVAIKILKQEFSEDINFVTKFRTEAQSAAGLEHPNIVNIYDVGSQDGMYYIVMEYVEGITLKTYIEKKGQLSFKESISIAIQVGRGIEAAHNKKIIHRDIKPQNIIISTEGKVKVTDFGIARAATSNTIHSDVMGSVHYSSPEQARNGFVDEKSDIYSLGIVMYEMVTGRVPFDGETTVAVAIQHLQEEMVAPSAYAPDLPISLEKIILKCTQKNVDRRYESMGDLLLDLKKSLINPDEDFVTIINPEAEGKTRKYTDEDIARIKQESANAAYEPEEEEEEEAEEYDGYGDEEDDESDGELNPKMEKAITIAGIVAAVIIVAIVVYLVGSFLGLFKLGSGAKKDKEDTKIEEDKDAGKDEDQDEQQSGDENEDAEVAMISLLGMTVDEATEKLSEWGITVQENGKQASEDYAEGEIVSQDIGQGKKVAKNSTVSVIVSSGIGEEEVPNVKGLDETSAINKLQDRGFKYSRDYQNSDGAASGTVISQSPEAGSMAKKGDTVSIIVSQGKEAVSVPDVKNRTEEEAKNELSAQGLVVASVTSEYSDTVPAGNVISQSIAPGKFVDAGSDITLVISNGPKTVYYQFSATISLPEKAVAVSADVILMDSTGEIIEEWPEVEASEFPYTIQKRDIEGSSSGTLEIIWMLEDGTMKTQDEDVTFDEQ